MSGATQAGRFMGLESPLGADVLLLERFHGSEGMSKTFLFEVDVLAEGIDKRINPDDLLGKSVTLRVSPNKEDDDERIIHGRVRRLTDLGTDVGSSGEKFRCYRLQVVPWFWFLSLNEDCRIFQKMTVTEIVEEVFSDWPDADYRLDCNTSYEKRDFTVQYRESDLDFVSRLLEQYGIFYFFTHEKDRHCMVIGDHVGALQDSPIRGDIRFMPDRGPRSLAEGVVQRLSLDAAVHTGVSNLDDYWYETPTANLLAEVPGDGVAGIYDYPGGYSTNREGEMLAKVRLEAAEVGASVLSGESNAVALLPGFGFNLSASDLDEHYLVLELRHQAGPLDYRATAGPVEEDGEGGPNYANTFTAIPYSTPYRPDRRTPVPRVTGVQTAVVVGPKGEETYTDDYGRVKVRFHWDRESPDDGESSCWIRVASTWAGNKWGAFQLPRVGQEVVVDFLEGSPDRPLVTGSVYNAQQMPPFSANATQSGWKSHSTKDGGAEANELRFDDKKDAEEVYLRAQKDHNVIVVNDETVEVGNDRATTIKRDDTLTVENNQTETVKKDQKITVENNQTETVKKDQKITVESNQTETVKKDQKITVQMGNRSIEVQKGNLTTKAPLGKMSFEALQAIEFKVGPSTLKIDPSGVTISGPMVKIDAKALAEIKGALAKMEAQGPVIVKGALAQVQGQGPVMVKGMPTMIG